MKRKFLYIILIGLVFAVPVEKLDVGKLQPVEVVSLYAEDKTVYLQTDTGDVGKGATAIEALKDLKETAAGVIYLDTAEFLLIREDAQQYAEALRDCLKDSVRVCLTEGKIDLKTAAKYLYVHGDFPKLKQWKPGDLLPILSPEKIIEKSRK